MAGTVVVWRAGRVVRAVQGGKLLDRAVAEVDHVSLAEALAQVRTAVAGLDEPRRAGPAA